LRGSRIQSIVRELNGEKIDIINWSETPEILITRAIAPAKPYDLYMDEERPYAVAVFEDEDLAIAIGRNGHNIKLASKVTGYTIESVKRTDYEGTSDKDNDKDVNTSNKEVLSEETLLSDVKGITSTQSSNFADNNIKTISDFLDSTDSELLKTKGIGAKSLEKIKELFKN
jgi:N utilization substance protein A